MRVIKATAHRVMAWKNGGGTTTEVAISPPGATTETFDWRVSMAYIQADGAFSQFPGVDRSLSILAGDGIILAAYGDVDAELTMSALPHIFPADIPCAARLHAGPVVDLNVMTRRGVYRSSVTKLRTTTPTKLTPSAETTLIFCYDGPLTVVSSTRQRHVQARDFIMLEASDNEFIIQSDGARDMFVIEISPVRH
ncbi:MAG: HutD family protein [Acidocella sp.]|nr:HutD family protein [Acidocella sp.]